MLLNWCKRRLLDFNLSWSTRTWKGDRRMITDPKKSGMFLQMLTVVVLMLFALCVGCGDTTTYYKDSDGDGYGDPDTAREAFAQPSGYVTKGEDCNDSDVAINPGATELCDDGMDNDCDGDSDSDDSDCPVPLLRSGFFTACSFDAEEAGLTWSTNSATFDCELDGIDTINVDMNRDGDFSDEVNYYEVEVDGTMRITSGPEGVFSQDGNTLAFTEADVADRLNFSIAVREGSGMNIDTFDGPYLVTKFAVNTSTNVAHTYTIMANETGYGLGLFGIMQSSNPAAIGLTSPFSYTVQDNGNITFVDSNEDGKITEDGRFFMAADTDSTNIIESIMIAMKLSSGATTASLQGEYIANLVGRNLVTGDYWSGRSLATFDGVGIVRYEFLDHTSAGGGLTGYMVYGILDSGLLAVVTPAGTELEVGMVSPDGNMFSVVDTDTSDGQIYLMIGIKKHS